MKKEFIVNRQGKDFVLYAGLLDQAHREGLKRITTQLLQAPDEQNGQLAICRAEVETEKGVFSGIGDASPQNVGRMIAMHTVRMAETRAKARALRDAINVGVTAVEELGEFDDGDDGALPMRSARQQNAVRTVQSVAAADRPAATQREAPLIALVREEGAASSDATTAASSDQVARLVKLQNSLGRAVQIPPDLTSEAAAAQITELVRIFNAQARASRNRRVE